MGMYTKLIFHGIVKEEFREVIDKVICYDSKSLLGSVYDLSEKWAATGIDFMVRFAEVPRANFIPSGIDYLWNKETGEWKFNTELKNYEDTYGKFFEIVPLFMKSIEECKTIYEEVDYYNVYELKEHRLTYVRSGDKFPELDD